MQVDLIDTSVLTNILRIPGFRQQADEVLEEFARRQRTGVQFVLPITTVVETGNHIAHVPDGHLRREAAEKFTAFLTLVADSRTPFILHEFGWNRAFIHDLCAGAGTGSTLTQHASSGVGTGDICILAERRALRQRFGPSAQVGVWTLDRALMSYADAD